MEGVQLRSKRGLKDAAIRRSYSCSDLAELLGGGSDGESGDSGAGESGAKRKGSDAEIRARGVSTLVKLRKKQSKRTKGGGPPVISSPVHPSSLPQPTRKLSTILPQNINFNNPFGTIGRRTKRKPREGMPVVVLEKCFGPPPSSTIPSVAEQNMSMYPHMNPFATLPRSSAKRRGPAKDSSGGSGGGDTGERNSRSANLESFLPPSSSSLSPSRSPSRSPSPSPSSSPSRAALSTEKTVSTNLTAPSYHSLIGKSMEKVC